MTELDYMRQWKHEESFKKETAKRQRVAKLKKYAASLGVSKSWCDPLAYDEIVGVDFGKGEMVFHKLHAEVDSPGIPMAKCADVLASFQRNTLVVCERAHLATPQTLKSLAQPFTAEQLKDIYGRCNSNGVTIKLFPHQHTTKCRHWAAKNAPDGFVKADKATDINDARALAYYVFNCNGIALGNPFIDFEQSDVRVYARHVKTISNTVLNAAAVRGYDGQVFPVVSRLSKKVLPKMTINREFVNEKVAFSLMSLVFTEHKAKPVRFLLNGTAPGTCCFLKNVLGSSSVHFRGGRARSNMFKHRFPGFLHNFILREYGFYVKKKSKAIPFSQYTPLMNEAKRAAWRKVRHELKLAYRIAVDLTADLEPFDPLQQEWEA